MGRGEQGLWLLALSAPFAALHFVSCLTTNGGTSLRFVPHYERMVLWGFALLGNTVPPKREQA